MTLDGLPPAPPLWLAALSFAYYVGCAVLLPISATCWAFYATTTVEWLLWGFWNGAYAVVLLAHAYD